MAARRSTINAVPRDAEPGVHALTLRVCGRTRTFEGRLSISTAGLLAVGAMVSSILLGAAAIVSVSTRKLPDDTHPRDL